MTLDWINPDVFLNRNGCDFVELASMWKTRRGPNRPSYVWKKHRCVVIFRYFAPTGDRWPEWKCTVFGMGTLCNVLSRGRGDPREGRDHPVGRRPVCLGLRALLDMFPHSFPQWRRNLLQLIFWRAIFQGRFVSSKFSGNMYICR